MNVGKYRVDQQTQFDGLERYAGLRVHGAPGVHAAILKLVQSIKPAPAQVLDLACGEGALAKRLIDAGYVVTACDFVPEKFQAGDGVRFVHANLNDDFAQKIEGPFDIVVASEIIEHLENPRHFLRELGKLLPATGGTLILTTPNCDSPLSRAIFLRTGYHKGFAPFDYRESGHITPMPLSCLEQALDETGFTIQKVSSAGKANVEGWWKMNLLAKIVSPLVDRHLKDECLIVLASRY